MQDITVVRLKSTRVQTPLSPFFKMLCTAWEYGISVESQNIPCTTLKRRGSWVISVYLWFHDSFFVLLSSSAKNSMQYHGYNRYPWKSTRRYRYTFSLPARYSKLCVSTLLYCVAVLRIYDILVLIWIRIRGPMPLTNGSGFGTGSYYFVTDLQEANKKII